MTAPETPLFVVRGDASDEEVAALLLVLGSLETAPPGDPAATVSEWAAPRRRLRSTYPSGRGGWRSSAQPR